MDIVAAFNSMAGMDTKRSPHYRSRLYMNLSSAVPRVCNGLTLTAVAAAAVAGKHYRSLEGQNFKNRLKEPGDKQC